VPGEFQLELAVYARPGECAFAAKNDQCEGAIELDPAKERQTLIGSLRCARDDSWAGNWCHDNFGDLDVYYHLDLSDRQGRTLLRATTDVAPTNADTALYLMEDVQGHCFFPLGCSGLLAESGEAGARTGAAELWADLAPGEYFLAVDGYSYGEVATDFGLLVELDEVECPPNRTRETAVDLSVVFEPRSYPYEPWCGSRDNQLFYRLDLRERTTPTLVGITAEHARTLMLLPEPGELPLAVQDLWLEEHLDVELEPGLYYLVVRLPSMVNEDEFNEPQNYRPGTFEVDMTDLAAGGQ